METVAFSYRAITGYAKTGAGPNFTLTVAGTAAFRSAPLDHSHPYNDNDFDIISPRFFLTPFRTP